MVEIEEIKNNYSQLLKLVEDEAKLNSSIWDYFDYLNEQRDKFLSDRNISFKENLKEFLRGANRYSDEFSFSDKHYSQIRWVTNRLYDILNNL